MFTEIVNTELLSVNKIANLKPGLYVENQLTFQKENETSSLVLRQFKREGDESFSVVDMICIDLEKSEVHLQDFVLLSDGEWQAGNGVKSFNLADFLPTDLADYIYVESVDGDVIEVIA